VADPRLTRILEQLRASGFADVKGARISLAIPIGERLLNDIVAASLPPSLPVRDLTVRPRSGNNLQVRARVAKLDFLPPVTVTLEIDQQPRLPDVPLGLRLRSFPGLTSLAGSILSPDKLPRGVRLEGDRLFVDVRELLDRAGYGDVAPLVERLHVASEEGRLLLEVDARV
jgi:hypothetical protein